MASEGANERGSPRERLALRIDLVSAREEHSSFGPRRFPVPSLGQPGNGSPKIAARASAETALWKSHTILKITKNAPKNYCSPCSAHYIHFVNARSLHNSPPARRHGHSGSTQAVLKVGAARKKKERSFALQPGFALIRIYKTASVRSMLAQHSEDLPAFPT